MKYNRYLGSLILALVSIVTTMPVKATDVNNLPDRLFFYSYRPYEFFVANELMKVDDNKFYGEITSSTNTYDSGHQPIFLYGTYNGSDNFAFYELMDDVSSNYEGWRQMTTNTANKQIVYRGTNTNTQNCVYLPNGSKYGFLVTFTSDANGSGAIGSVTIEKDPTNPPYQYDPNYNGGTSGGNTDPVASNLSDTLSYQLVSYATNGGTYTPANDLTVWYDGTVTDMLSKDQQYCLDGYTLLIGNGQLGAELANLMPQWASNTPHRRTVFINEKGLFGGGPNASGTDSEHFESFGKLEMTTTTANDNPASNKISQIDLTTAVATSIVKTSGGRIEAQEWLSSYPDQVIAARITINSGSLSYNFAYSSAQSASVISSTDGNTAIASFSGKLSGTNDIVSYASNLRIVAVDGTVTASGGTISVSDASEILIYISAVTNYDPSVATQLSTASASELASLAATRTASASTKGWAALLQDHTADYSAMFNRMSLTLDGQTNNLETASMLKNYSSLTAGQKRMFENLIFAFGRYVEIATSRPYDNATGLGLDSPSNLLGIWTAGDHNWRCDIHANINVNMNYWPSELTNLSETHLALCNWIIKEANLPLWQNMTANSNYGELATPQGWTAPTCINPFGGGDMYNAKVYNAAQAWLCAHLIQHYLYTLDETYGSMALPVLWEACRFWQADMKLVNGKYLVSSEWSPEHGSAYDGLPHAQQLVWYLYKYTIEMANKLGVPSGKSASDLDALTDIFANLDNGVHVNNGALEEWPGATPVADSHRHLSHMMCMYPLGTIHLDDADDVFSAAEQSLVYRGDVGYGDTDLAVWTTAWKACCWAQARDQRAFDNYVYSFTLAYDNGHEYGLYPNLISMNHYPQIDGTFGNTAAVAEMLLQSNRSEVTATSPFAYVDIAPALPTAWTKGQADGLKAQGNIEVGFTWENGKATEIHLKAVKGANNMPIYLHYDALGDNYEVRSISGMTQDTDETITKWDADHVWKFVPSANGATVSIILGNVSTEPEVNYLAYNQSPKPNADEAQEIKHGTDVIATVMFGTNGVKYYDASSNQFQTGGVQWTVQTPGIEDYSNADNLSGCATAAQASGVAAGIPYTEVNGSICGSGTNNGSTNGLWLTPVAGDFIRIEPNYSGTVNLWVKQTSNTNNPLYIMDQNGQLVSNVTYTGANTSNNGYVAQNGSNKVKYSFPVKGGMTYYVALKDALLSFVAADMDKATESPATYTLKEGDTTAPNWPTAGTTVNYKLTRTFHKGWMHPIVLPFSVSESKMREIFGDDVIVLYLDPYAHSRANDTPSQNEYKSVLKQAVEYDSQIAANRIRFTRHFYQMLYAGVPAYIIPSKDVTDPTFTNVTFETSDIRRYALDSNGDYSVTGSYTAITPSASTMYYVNNSGSNDNKITLHHTDPVAMKGMRVWIQATANAQQIKGIGFNSFTDDEEDMGTTGIVSIVAERAAYDPTADNRVYNMLGIPVANGTTEGLAPGIYIYRGRKIAIK